jgi:hypothetical protein
MFHFFAKKESDPHGEPHDLAAEFAGQSHAAYKQVASGHRIALLYVSRKTIYTTSLHISINHTRYQEWMYEALIFSNHLEQTK